MSFSATQYREIFSEVIENMVHRHTVFSTDVTNPRALSEQFVQVGKVRTAFQMVSMLRNYSRCRIMTADFGGKDLQLSRFEPIETANWRLKYPYVACPGNTKMHE